MKYTSIIEDFFLGKLESEALEKFKIDLETNSELRDEFLTYQRAFRFVASQEKSLIENLSKLKEFEFDPNIVDDIEKYGKKQVLDTNESELLKLLKEENKKGERKIVLKTRRCKWFGIAAGILLLIGIISLLILRDRIFPGDEELFNNYYTPYQHSFSTRSSFDENRQNLIEGIVLYDKGHYNQALKTLNEVEDSTCICLEIKIIKAVCYIELEEYQQALGVLETVDRNSLLYYTSLWYKGLCYVKIKEDRKAFSVFKEISSVDPYYKKKSRSLIRYLR
jgi:tetratricopeptide (TPR) repeat protein